uniref:G_PROTEIN_RECEP_F1_2 domain-containing protein n=1 Tax=Elaeophora elaphi TaxID=1147741 RepID=A0A0R3RQZ7_9BILA
MQDPQCSWTAWSPCTVTCMSRGSSSVYSQQWQRFICKDANNSNDNSSITAAKFRSCAHMIPLCLSDEGFSMAFQNYYFLAIFLVCILLAFLPNMILGLCYARIWIWKSRKSGEKSEQSVQSLKGAVADNFLSN